MCQRVWKYSRHFAVDSLSSGLRLDWLMVQSVTDYHLQTYNQENHPFVVLDGIIHLNCFLINNS